MTCEHATPAPGVAHNAAREFIVEAISWAETTDSGRLGGERAETLLAAHEARIKADAIAQERAEVALLRELKESYHEQWMLTQVELVGLVATLGAASTEALDAVKAEAARQALLDAGLDWPEDGMTRSEAERWLSIDRETGGVGIYWFTPGGRLRRIDLTRAEAFKALAQLALGLAETEVDR